MNNPPCSCVEYTEPRVLSGESVPKQHQWVRLWRQTYCDHLDGGRTEGHRHGWSTWLPESTWMIAFFDSNEERYGYLMGCDDGVSRKEIAVYGPVIPEPNAVNPNKETT